MKKGKMKRIRRIFCYLEEVEAKGFSFFNIIAISKTKIIKIRRIFYNLEEDGTKKCFLFSL